MIDIRAKKEKIISYLKINGPSLPVRISKAAELEPFLGSAVLSEILGEGRIKTSNMKVGSSYLYLLEGQEEQLEKFAEYLKSGEKVAYLKLKKEKILKDSSEEPAIRVALRSIKDFAIPFRYNEELMWRYAFVSEEEVRKMFGEGTEKGSLKENAVSEKEEIISKREEIIEKKQITEDEKEERKEPLKVEKQKTKQEDKKIIQKPGEEKIIENIFEVSVEKPEFYFETLKFLKSKNIELLEEIQTDKKEIVGKVSVNSALGKMNFLLISKNKKSVSKDEIISSLQRATHSKMPCLIVIRKEPTKAIEKLIEDNSLIKILSMD